MNKKHRLTTISISYENYRMLKRLGNTGDSFNDVLTKILQNLKLPECETKSLV
jgi:predicted CopG family antitoxin